MYANFGVKWFGSNGHVNVNDLTSLMNMLGNDPYGEFVEFWNSQFCICDVKMKLEIYMFYEVMFMWKGLDLDSSHLENLYKWQNGLCCQTKICGATYRVAAQICFRRKVAIVFAAQILSVSDVFESCGATLLFAAQVVKK